MGEQPFVSLFEMRRNKKSITNFKLFLFKCKNFFAVSNYYHLFRFRFKRNQMNLLYETS
jgi:hypothetical protein